ncbi:MAG: hypothetical protein V1857_06655 [archaeon]
MSYYYVPRPPLQVRCLPPRQEFIYQPPPERHLYQPPAEETLVEQPPDLYYLPPPEVQCYQPPPQRCVYQPPPEEYYYQPPPQMQYYQPPAMRVTSPVSIPPETSCFTPQAYPSPTYPATSSMTSYPWQQCGPSIAAWNYPYWCEGTPRNVRFYDPRTLPIKR